MDRIEFADAECPLYAVTCLAGGFVVVGGGGGSGNYGVQNLIEIHKLVEDIPAAATKETDSPHSDQKPSQNSHYKTELIHRIDVERRVVTALTAHPTQTTHFFALANEMCSEYNVQGQLKHTVRSDTQSADDNCCQKLLRFNEDGSKFVTGGTDKRIALWNYDGLTSCNTVNNTNTHTDEIIGGDYDPASKCWVTIGRDQKVLKWSVDGSKCEELALKSSLWTGVKGYQVKSCRFVKVEGKSLLLTLHSHAKQYSYIAQWCPSDWHKVTHGREKHALTAMAVSPDMQLVAAGSAEGTVTLFDSHSLVKLRLIKEVHSLFVTDLCFTADSRWLVSVSADRSCVATRTDVDLKTDNFWVTFILLAICALLAALLAVYL